MTQEDGGRMLSTETSAARNDAAGINSARTRVCRLSSQSEFKSERRANRIDMDVVALKRSELHEFPLAAQKHIGQERDIHSKPRRSAVGEDTISGICFGASPHFSHY